MMRIEENIDEYTKELDAMVPRRKFHTLRIENTAKYAIYVHSREGYHVIDDEHAAQTIDEALSPLLESSFEMTDEILEALIEKAADVEIDRLQAFTGAYKPPVRKGLPDRPVHSGNWADISTKLASSFRTKVNNRASKTHEYDGLPQV